MGAVVDRAARTADTPPAIENADGLGCHGDKTRETTWPGGTPRSLFVDESVFATSIHGRNRCISCRGDIVEVPHPDGFRPKDVSCAQCRAARRIVTQYQLAPDVMSTYVESLHGLALKGGNPTVAACASCHGVHDILPSSDPMSSVNPKDLPQTCGRCHPGIGTRLAAEFFKVHAPKGPRQDKPWVVNLVSIAYIVLIVVTIGGMWLFVVLDYRRKTRDHVRAAKAEYWALVWGSVVMIITGIMRVYSEAVLRLWPKVWNDLAQVIHYYEAVLATLAILVWHAYWVVFDPAEYPMNPSWLIGTRAAHRAPEPDAVKEPPAPSAS